LRKHHIYRPENQAIFTGRENQLAQLVRYLLREHPADLHLSGLRRIGKAPPVPSFLFMGKKWKEMVAAPVQERR
jgi:hypothetical protein